MKHPYRFADIVKGVNYYNCGDMNTREALIIAYNVLMIHAPSPKIVKARAVVAALIAQKGCEHLYSDNGYLTSTCDVAIFG